MHPNETYVNETWPGNSLEPGSSSNSVPKTYVNETWPVNILGPGSSSNSVQSPWTDASLDRLLQNQHSNSMYPRFAVPGEHYYPIENQHLNSEHFEGAEEFYLINNAEVNPTNPERAAPGGIYLFANQQISYPEDTFPGEQFCNFDNRQVDSVYPEDAVMGEHFSIHDLHPGELTDYNNQSTVELGEFHQYSYYNYIWPSQAGGAEGASSSASVPSSCQTVCSTPEPEPLPSPLATDPSAEKNGLLPAEHCFASPEVATSDYEGVTKKKKARKTQCEVRISKKLLKSNDMLKKKLWITFAEAEQAARAKRLASYLLSGSKTKHMDTRFDPDIEPVVKALKDAVQAKGELTTDMYCKVKDLAKWYGEHGAT